MINPSDDKNIPEGLDDLLNSIRNEKSSDALAVYVPDSREEDLVSEEIDERILRLLGLEDAVDLDYATYKSLLREKMMAGRMAGATMASEETELLTDEFKRVKRNTGRFKVKTNKINFNSFVDTTKPKGPSASSPSSPMLALPGTVEPKETETPKEEKVEEIQKFLGGVSERLEKIEKNLSDMLDLEADQARVEKKEAEDDRITGEKQKKRKKESALESGLGGAAKKIGEKVMKPVKGFFEQLLNFFLQIFLGSAVMGIIKLLEDPLMIFNPFINFINNIIGFINQILNFLFEGLVSNINFMMGFINGGIGNLENTINGIFGLFGEQEEDDKLKLPRVPEAEVPQIPLIPLFKPKEEKKEETPIEGKFEGGIVGGYTEGGQVTNINLGGIGGWKGGSMTVSPKVSGFEGGGEIKPTYNFLSPITNFGYDGGGSITSSSGQTITGMGPDTQLIAAQPGEIVMSKKAVQAYGANNLLAMNKEAGGTNIPTMGTVQGFQGGGMVSLSPSANYDVIIPLDHTTRPGTIPDTPGGNTFKASNATGAAGREREHQDPAARLIANRMAAQGMRVRIYSPEDAGDYQTYDRYLEQQAKLGVRILPLHFDAGIDPNTGKMVGTGFLTRTRAGDREDAQFAAPIQRVLEDFQKLNPDLGRISKDTDDNATVNKGAASPTALVELGVMTFWEKKYGKNFTQTPEFMEFANNIADAAVQGSGLRTGVQPSQSKVPSVQPFTKVEGVDPSNFAVFNSMSEGQRSRVLAAQAGDTIEGTRVTSRMQFELQKYEVGLAQHRKATASKAKVGSVTSPTITASPNVGGDITPPVHGATTLSMVGGPQQQTQQPNAAAPTAAQKEVPSFSSRDLGNTEFIVIKSIYNIVA